MKTLLILTPRSYVNRMLVCYMDHIFNYCFIVHMHMEKEWSKLKGGCNVAIPKMKRNNKKTGWLCRKKGLVRGWH